MVKHSQCFEGTCTSIWAMAEDTRNNLISKMKSMKAEKRRLKNERANKRKTERKLESSAGITSNSSATSKFDIFAKKVLLLVIKNLRASKQRGEKKPIKFEQRLLSVDNFERTVQLPAGTKTFLEHGHYVVNFPWAEEIKVNVDSLYDTGIARKVSKEMLEWNRAFNKV